MKKRRTLSSNVNMAIFKDLAFPRNCPGADYDTCWAMCFRDRNIFAVTACYESAVLFAARLSKLTVLLWYLYAIQVTLVTFFRGAGPPWSPFHFC